MKITIYTINDCKFSQAEKEYLKKANIEFEEKNLETNRDFLTEMLAISNNFAGTPVTQIEKDSGEKIILKGFTAEEFDKALGLSTVTATEPQEEPQIIPPAQAPAPQEAAPEPQPSVEAAPAADVVPPTPVAAPAPAEPVIIESLSEDTSHVTPSQDLQPPVPPISTEPLPQANADSVSPQAPDAMQSTPSPVVEQPPTAPEAPAPQQTIEPVSLDVTPTPEVSPTPQEPVAPVPTQPQTNPLDSVLQNLQSQVNETEEKKDQPAS